MASVGIDVQKDIQATIEVQATWDTAIDTTPLILPTDDLEITLEPGNVEIPVQNGSRQKNELYMFNDSSAKLGKATFSCPMTSKIAYLFGFPGIFQKNVAWAATTNVFTYTPLEQADLPAMKSDTDAGYKYTICARAPTIMASSAKQLKNCIGTNFELSLHPTEHDGLLWLKTEWLGEGYSEVVDLDADGTALPLGGTGSELYKFIEMDFATIATNAQLNSLHDFKISYTYNAFRQGNTIRGDTAFPAFESKLTVTLFADTYTDALSTLCRTSAVSTGIAALFRWGDGTVSGAGEMNLDFFGLPKTSQLTYIDGAKAWTFELEGCLGGATEYPFSAAVFYTV